MKGVANLSLLLVWLLTSWSIFVPITAVSVTTAESSSTASSDDECTNNDIMASNKYQQDGPEAKEIAQYLPYFPFKGIPRFYDIGGFLYEPSVFQKIVDIFTERYQAEGLQIDVIAGLDARGFILGPPIALALKKPFVMMRKKGYVAFWQDETFSYGDLLIPS